MTIRARLKRLFARVTIVNEFCHDCGTTQPVVWTAPDTLWAEVTGRTDGGGVLCPTCFDRRADAAGLSLRWMPLAEEVARLTSADALIRRLGGTR